MEFIEVKCPKCGASMMVNSQLKRCTCNSCGMDIIMGGAENSLTTANDLYEQEKARLQAQKDFKDEQDRIERQKRRERQEEIERREHQRLLDEVELPAPYGTFYDYKNYIIAGGIVMLIGILGSSFWLFGIGFIVLAAPSAYIAYKRNKNYKHVMEDPDKYREWKVKQLYKQWDEEDRLEKEEERYGRDGNGLRCPHCGSHNTYSQVFQENLGSSTWQDTSYKFKEKGHGCLWWLLIGWWWWMVDLMLWIFAFFPRLIIKLFASGWKRKKYVGSSSTRGGSVNRIGYTTMHTCNNCGHTWRT